MSDEKMNTNYFRFKAEDEDALLSVLFVALAGVLIVSIICTMSYWKHHNNLVVKAIKEGANPVSVMCAFQDSYGNNPTCIVLASKYRAE